MPVLSPRLERAVLALASESLATLGMTTRAKVFPLTLPAASRAATWKERASLSENAPISAESWGAGMVWLILPFAYTT